MTQCHYQACVCSPMRAYTWQAQHSTARHVRCHCYATALQQPAINHAINKPTCKGVECDSCGLAPICCIDSLEGDHLPCLLDLIVVLLEVTAAVQRARYSGASPAADRQAAHPVAHVKNTWHTASSKTGHLTGQSHGHSRLSSAASRHSNCV